MDECSLAAKPRDEPGGSRSKQERPIGGGEDVDNVNVLEAAPQIPEVDGLAQNRSEAAHALSPAQSGGKRRVYSYKGVGLAAQQVSVARQLTVIDVRGVTDRPSSLELNGQPSDVAGFMPLVLLRSEEERRVRQ